jgi:long-subunit acyl-CoA synthetase (AMP-forming)
MRGYRDDPDQTAEAIDSDGWLHTGDIATIDEEGYVRIVDRKQELIVSADGETVSPANIANAIASASPFIGHVMVVGDGRPYNVALIVLDPDAAAAFAVNRGLDTGPASVVKDERVQAAVAAAVDAGNAALSRAEQIERFTVLPVYWLPGGDELTPTFKLRRRQIAARYAAEIDELYRQDATRSLSGSATRVP